MSVFEVQSGIMAVVTLVLFGVKSVAFVDAVSRRAEAYVAADKLTKQAWTIILGLSVLANMLFWRPLSLLNLVGIIAAFVYLLDVRPALRGLTRR